MKEESTPLGRHEYFELDHNSGSGALIDSEMDPEVQKRHGYLLGDK